MTSGYQQFFNNAKRAAVRDGAGGRQPPPAQAKAKVQVQPQQSGRPARPATAEALRDRLRAKAIRRKRQPPWKLILTSGIGIIVAATGIYNMNKVERIAKSVEISMMGMAMAEEVKPNVTPTTTPTAEKSAEKVTTEKKQYSDEEIDHFAKLNERKAELDARETELNRMEAELAAQKEELEKRLKDLEGTRRQISSVLDDRVQADDKKVDSLVQVYSSMKPQQAAKIFETMDEDLAIEILGRMKKKPAAEILNLVKAEKAQVLSEKYAGYKRK